MSRSAFLGEGWNAEVEVIDGVVSIDLMLVGIGVSGRAQLVLPVGGTKESLATLVAALYADEELLRHAVRVHLDQHSVRPGCVAGVASIAKRAKSAPCAGRFRR